MELNLCSVLIWSSGTHTWIQKYLTVEGSSVGRSQIKPWGVGHPKADSRYLWVVWAVGQRPKPRVDTDVLSRPGLFEIIIIFDIFIYLDCVIKKWSDIRRHLWKFIDSSREYMNWNFQVDYYYAWLQIPIWVPCECWFVFRQ